MSKISFQNRKLLNDHSSPPSVHHGGGWSMCKKPHFRIGNQKSDRSCLLIGASVLSSIVNNFTCCKLHFSTEGRGGGGSEREKLLLGGGGGGSEGEKLLLVWDSFLQSQEIEVEYTMSSTDDIMILRLRPSQRIYHPESL